jgi:hypothetical protein
MFDLECPLKKFRTDESRLQEFQALHAANYAANASHRRAANTTTYTADKAQTERRATVTYTVDQATTERRVPASFDAFPMPFRPNVIGESSALPILQEFPNQESAQKASRREHNVHGAGVDGLGWVSSDYRNHVPRRLAAAAKAAAEAKVIIIDFVNSNIRQNLYV